MAAPMSTPGNNESGTPTKLDQKKWASGQEGERIYLRRLRKLVAQTATGSHQYTLVYSLNLPRAARDKAGSDTDVDFALASGKRLVLVNAKYWRASGTFWSVPLPPRELIELLGSGKHTASAKWVRKNLLGRTVALRNLGPHTPDGKWFASNNDAMAVERYHERLTRHGVKVTGLVAFVQTPNKPDQNVGLLRWPGGIRSFKEEESLEELRLRLGRPEPVHPAISTLLNQMKRR